GGASLHASYVDFRKLSVRGELRDAVIDGTFAFVGEALFLELLDQRDHVFDVISGADKLFGHLDVQRVDVLEEGLDVFVREFADADSCSGGGLDDAVVHVGDVHHLHHAQPLGFQKAAENVLKHEGAEIADVGAGVNRGAAGIHADFAGMQRL